MFLLNDVFRINRYDNLPGFADASPDVVEADPGGSGEALPSRCLPRSTGPATSKAARATTDGSVTTPKGFKEAYRQYAEGGWMGISAPAEFGGQGLPETLTVTVNEFMAAANMAFAMYPGLTQGAIAALLGHGTPAQKATYLPPMIAGKWTGTMNLTEPHCGTDLGLLRTKAVPQADGSYKITGTKIFISAGEHDLADNIVHLVLARIEGAPAGTKGLPCSWCRNSCRGRMARSARTMPSTCGSIEEKMGIHGNSTCVLNFENASGWLIGQENRGLAGHVRDDERGAHGRRRAGPRGLRRRLSERRDLCAASGSRAAPYRVRNFPTSRPIRSSCIPTCGAP